MGEKHDYLVRKYKGKLLGMGYAIRRKSPFVDYRPDICAEKKKEKVFAEIELDKSLHTDHTLDQLGNMHKYVRKSTRWAGVLVVPRGTVGEARLLVKSVFGDRKIRVIGL